MGSSKEDVKEGKVKTAACLLSSCYFHNSEEQVKIAADAMDSTLVSQCLALCQTLANQGKDFSFNLTINSSFSFSLDTRESKVNSTLGKKRTSPSTRRRNARRREEFLRKKLSFSPCLIFCFGFSSRNLSQYDYCGSFRCNLHVCNCLHSCSGSCSFAFSTS